MVKLGIAGAVVVAAAAILLTLYASATERGRELHCRNNLRHLGTHAVSNWQLVDPSKTGRLFWHEVRIAQYRDVNGKWKEMNPDPFVCPVHARTATNREDPKAIDYRGPKKLPDDLKDFPKGAPLGADRPGNHASGGWVLRLDGSVEALSPLVDRVRDGSPPWAAAADALTD